MSTLCSTCGFDVRAQAALPDARCPECGGGIAAGASSSGRLRNLALLALLFVGAIVPPIVIFAMGFIGIMLFFHTWPAWYIAIVLITAAATPIVHGLLGWFCGRCMSPPWPWWAGAGAGLLLTLVGAALFVGLALLMF